MSKSHLHLSRQLVQESRARIQAGRAAAERARQRIRRRAIDGQDAEARWNFGLIVTARVEQSLALITMSRDLIRIARELMALSRRRR